MIPLNLADTGEELTVKRVGGGAKIKQHLEDFGFTAGSPVLIVNKLGGNIIVKVKESRIAINDETARRIMV